MSTKIFSLLLSFTLLFSACSTKTTYKKDTTSIYTFLQNKEGSLYVFFDDSYTYVINDAKNVKKLKQLFQVTRTIKEWKFSHTPTIGLKNGIATMYLNIDISAKRKNLSLIKQLHFKKSNMNSKLIHKTFKLKAKYSKTVDIFKDKYFKKSLNKPLKIKRINYNTSTKKTNISGAGAVAAAIVGIPLLLVGGILLTPFTKKFPD